MHLISHSSHTHHGFSTTTTRLQVHGRSPFLKNALSITLSSLLFYSAVAPEKHKSSRKAAIPGGPATPVSENGRPQDRAKMVEHGWLDFFEDPSMWGDNRKTKRNPKYPDFVHATTGESLWIDSSFCPKWVQPKLQCLQNSTPTPGRGVRAHYRKIAGAFHGAGRAGYAVFKPRPQWNEFSWTKLISEHTKCGQSREALRIYKEMREEGVTPKSYTFVAALKACSTIADLEAGKEIHAHVVANGDQSDIFVATTLVDMYAKCGSMADARQVFENMPYRNVVSWNAMIMGYAQQEAGELALELYARMQLEGFMPDARTVLAALKACGSLAVQEGGKQVDGELVKFRCLEKGRIIHSQIAKSGFESDIFVGNTLVDMYAKCGSMVDACRVFERMPHRDVVSWNAMIMAYAQKEAGESALQLYARMQHEGFTPNARTFVAVLKACGSLAAQEGKPDDGELVKIGCLEKGRIIHSQVAKSGLESHTFVANTLVDMYAKCGSMVDACRVFERMPYRDEVSWTAMIMGYAQKEEGELALQLYARMQHEGFRPDAHTFVATLKACGSLASLKIGKEIHAEICRAGLEDDAFVANCLVDMYGKCGSMVDAQRLFDASPPGDVVRWNALIAGYSHQGDSERVFELFERMDQEGMQPVGTTFVSVLTACSHAGLLDKGQKYFQAMCSDYGITPAREHYSCMVDLLGRAGQLDEAMAMVKKMPFKPDMVIWMTILGACRKWNNVEVGRRAFECAVRLDEKQGAAYVLMTNIYVSACMWEESSKIQARKMNAQAWKEPGQCWWTDSAGTVHTFLAEDRNYPQSKDIYAKLKDIFVKMEEEAHVPELDSL